MPWVGLLSAILSRFLDVLTAFLVEAVGFPLYNVIEAQGGWLCHRLSIVTTQIDITTCNKITSNFFPLYNLKSDQ